MPKQADASDRGPLRLGFTLNEEDQKMARYVPTFEIHRSRRSLERLFLRVVRDEHTVCVPFPSVPQHHIPFSLIQLRC